MKTIHFVILGIIVALAGTAWAAPKTKKQVLARGGKGGCYKCDLRGIDLSGKRMFMDSFQESNLQGAIFDKARLKGVNFIKADLTGASFKGADLTKANFEGANLTNADFTGAKFNQTNVRLATLTGTKGLPIPDAVPDPPHGRCFGKNICGLSPVKEKVAVPGLNPEHLKKVKDQVKFNAKVRCPYCSLEGADLSNLDMRQADLKGAYLKGANLSGSNLTRASLRGANLEGANLQKAQLMRTRLQGANLTDADFCGAVMQKISVRGAYSYSKGVITKGMRDSDCRIWK